MCDAITVEICACACCGACKCDCCVRARAGRKTFKLNWSAPLGSAMEEYLRACGRPPGSATFYYGSQVLKVTDTPGSVGMFGDCKIRAESLPGVT